jgi:hypothetical protein
VAGVASIYIKWHVTENSSIINIGFMTKHYMGVQSIGGCTPS